LQDTTVQRRIFIEQSDYDIQYGAAAINTLTVTITRIRLLFEVSWVVEISCEGKEAKRNESMARARSNVVKTLATVAFFFIFCWTWNQTYYLMF